MPATVRPAVDPATLRQRLTLLRRRLRLVATWRGVSLVLALVLTALVTAGLLDWSVHLPGLVRALILVGTLTGAGYLAYRYLFLPLSDRVDDLTLALRIEESYPSLNDALASTVQFLDQVGQPSVGDSVALRREAVRRALATAAGCDFNRIVDARGLVPSSVCAATAAAVALPLLFLFPALASTAVARLVNPFGIHDWPKKTLLELDNPRLQVGRNRPYVIRGKVQGVLPKQARVLFRCEGLPSQEQVIDIEHENDKLGRLVAQLKPDQVQRDFSFQVFANDAVTKKYEVKVLPPPVLTSLNGEPSPQVELNFPAYTDLPSPWQLPPGVGNIEAVAGTSVRFRAAADRPLARAWIEYQPEQRHSSLAGFLAPLGATHLAGVLALSAGGQTVWDRVPASLSDDRRVMTIAFLPRLNGLFVLFFEDDNGLSDFRLFELRLHPDPAPTVTLERPTPTRDILAMLPTAEVNVRLSAEDTQFALKSVFLRYRTRREDPPRLLSWYDHATAPERLVAPVTGGAALTGKSLKLRPTRLDMRQMLSLKRIKHPDGSSLREGDVVILQACADDFDDITPNKQPGVSHEVEIRIVSLNALDLILNQEQAAVQQELLKLREKEREAIQKVLEPEKRLKRGEKLTPEEQEKLLQAEQIQQQIHERIGTPEKGLRAEINRIQETLKQNGMRNSAVRDRMADVNRELERLAERDLEQVEARLSTARKKVEQQAQLEEKGREDDKLAQGEEDTANRKNADAAQAQQKAARAANEKERAQLESEAQRLKQQAEAARQKAEELRDKAAAERKEAAGTSPRQQLTEARQHQEEVEKTLNDLLMRLEPWSSAREVKGEAKRLLQEQKQMQAQLEELEKKQLGKELQELSKEQQADLQNLREQQQRLAEQANQLLDKMNRLAEQRAEKDPEMAREMREARQQALESNIPGQMKNAGEQIEQNQLGKAQESQKQSVAGLEKLVKNLEDRREAELDRLAKKLREAEKKLDELREEQERLAKKVKEAQQIADPAKREEELKKLSREQQRLQEKTQDLAKQLSRLRAERASQTLAKAGSQMDQAGQQMRNGQNPEDPREALERLDEAKREVERARKQAEDELQREQLTRVADVLQRIKERQDGQNTEATRIQDDVLRNKGWTRGLLRSMSGLGDSEQGLGTEAEEVGRKELTSTPVFARVVKRAAEAMQEAGARAKALKEQALTNLQPAPDTLPDAQLKQYQDQATKRLAQVLAAIKEQVGGNQGQAGGGQAGGGEGGEGGGGGGAEDNGLPPIAQLKLLKALQQEVNQQTDAFKKKHPDLDKLAEGEKAELQAIRKMQQDVVELLEELRRPADEPGENEGDKK